MAMMELIHRVLNEDTDSTELWAHGYLMGKLKIFNFFLYVLFFQLNMNLSVILKSYTMLMCFGMDGINGKE